MNSTILAWQFAGYNIFWWIISSAFLGYVVWLCLAHNNAMRNSKNLRRPDWVADSLFTIGRRQWISFREAGAKVIVFDVDLTLCSMHADELRDNVWRYLQDLRNLGYKIILASKSNPHLDEIYRDLNGDESWLLIWSGASKSSMTFLRGIKDRIRQAKWTLGLGYKIILVGDKLTDMGYSDADENSRVITILTNPQFGKDLPLETFPAMRRWRENITLREYWGIKRAAHGEFRRVQ
jgi:predicted HAD superfamily phosphohydrolase YqeG